MVPIQLAIVSFTFRFSSFSSCWLRALIISVEIGRFLSELPWYRFILEMKLFYMGSPETGWWIRF